MPRFQRPPVTSFRAEETSSSAASRRAFLKLGCACCAMLAAPSLAFGQTPSPGVAQHLAAAKEAAGSDLTAYLTLGQSADPNFKPESPDLKALMTMPAPPPGKAFDNLYFVGSKWVSCWAITTSAGIILIDAMDNEDEAQRIVEGGLKTLGLDPAEVKTIIVTHGHGDHYGGANYFVDKYKSRVVASEADWTMMETKLEFDSPLWDRPPRRDVSVTDGAKVTLGDTTLDILVTPGHTMGTISPLFDVWSGSQKHRALLWGGTAFNFGKKPERLQAYIGATARALKIAKQQGVDVFISNHSQYDHAVEKLAEKKADGPNPFVLGEATVQRALTVMNECAQATLALWSS
ncbi:MBL fold metallo-hydrolase [Bradyrhizobium sp. Tv2a-2]|uniref:MBL fold metallo-hydrolase n=1 Tax=Bradyrhizobium sp. Tv2a-2 TaxID=113395 RepID=UPI00041B77B7|nr:MBL fold metallo-hydrolase [Bradyrhizobium sp. Tv2a-2]